MLKSYSHKQRILEILRERGEYGIHSFELIRLVTHKCATRVSELRSEGWPIEVRREKKGDAWGVRYTLEEEHGNSGKGLLNRINKWATVNPERSGGAFLG